MRRKTNLIIFMLTGMTVFCFANLGFGQEVTVAWDVANAKVSGDGCYFDPDPYSWDSDTFIFPTGNQLTMLFSDMGVQHSGNGKNTTKIKKYCDISIPVSVPAGWYLEKLHHTVFYGWAKTDGSHGNIKVRTKFFNVNQTPINININKDDESVPYEESSGDLYLDKVSCKNKKKSTKGTLNTSLDISAWAKDIDESIDIQVDGGDYRVNLYITGVLKPCP